MVVVEQILLVQTYCCEELHMHISQSTVTNSPVVHTPLDGVVGVVVGVVDLHDDAEDMSQSLQLLVITSSLLPVSVAHHGVAESAKVHWL